MSIASGLEMRRRKRQHKPVRFPAAVLSCAVALSIAAQVVEAERSVIGCIAAALPALGFLVMVKIALGRMAPSSTAIPQLTQLAANGHEPGLPARPARPGEGTGDIQDHPHAASPGGAATRSATARATGTGQARRARRSRPTKSIAAADVAHLLPAATAADQMLTLQGRALTHKTLPSNYAPTGTRYPTPAPRHL